MPFGDDRLAGVVTVPEGNPVGMVLLSTGLGVPRSHRFQVWTRIARGLAGRDVASVRYDYRGIGDSTGLGREWDMNEPVLEQALTMARFGLRATGAERVAAAGNCVGALLSLRVAAALPESAGALCIQMPIVGIGNPGPLEVKIRRTRLAAVLKKVPPVRKVAKVVTHRESDERWSWRQTLRMVLGRGSVLFLYGSGDIEFKDEVNALLERERASLPMGLRERFEVRALPGQRLEGLESIDMQQLVVDTVVGWMADLFTDAAAPAAASQI